jgi:hypothetical protein
MLDIAQSNKVVFDVFCFSLRRIMRLNVTKWMSIIGIISTFASRNLTAQFAPADAKSPKAVVASFVEVETEGGRLTPEGWRKASAFFVRSSPFTPDTTIVVIEKSYSVWDPMVIPPNTTSVTVEIRPLGQIDSILRYTAPTRRFYKTSRHFNLVQTDHRWEVGAKGEPSKKVTVPMQWLIDGPNDTLMLDVATAIRYVTDRRDKTSDPTVKSNADKTLASLAKLH